MNMLLCAVNCGMCIAFALLGPSLYDCLGADIFWAAQREPHSRRPSPQRRTPFTPRQHHTHTL